MSSRAERGDVEEILEIPNSCESLRISFNAQYLIDVIRNVEDDLMRLCFNTNISPCLVLPEKSDQFKYLVLPVITCSLGTLASIARMTRSLAEDEAYLTSLAADWLSAQPSDELSAAALAALPRPIAVRALRRWLGEDVSAEHLEDALSLCQAGPSAVLDLPGRRLCRRNDALTLTETEATPLPERMLVPGGTLLLPEAGGDGGDGGQEFLFADRPAPEDFR